MPPVVQPTVPLIFSPKPEPGHVSLYGRFVALLLSLGCLTLLVLAALLTPDPSGLGTHMGLGLPACSWIRNYGIPCPTCGMTTSFSWFARGNFLASFYIQPMGAVLAILATVTFWAGLYIAATGRAAYQMLRYIPARYMIFPFFAFWLLAWCWKIFIHVHGIDGWR